MAESPSAYSMSLRGSCRRLILAQAVGIDLRYRRCARISQDGISGEAKSQDVYSILRASRTNEWMFQEHFSTRANLSI